MVSYWVRYLSLGLGSGWASIGLIDGYLGLGLDFGFWVLGLVESLLCLFRFRRVRCGFECLVLRRAKVV